MSVYTGLINCLAKNIQCANSKAPLKRGWRKPFILRPSSGLAMHCAIGCTFEKGARHKSTSTCN